MYILALLFASVIANTPEMEELNFLSVMYGYNDCFGVAQDDFNDWDKIAELGCIIVYDEEGNPQTRAASQLGASIQCKQNMFSVQNLDLMPIHFNYGIVERPECEAFKITLNDGSVAYPECVIFDPATEGDERQSPLLLGNWGNGFEMTQYPVKVELIGDVLFNVNGVVQNGKGMYLEDWDMMKFDKGLRIVEALVDFASNLEAGDDDNNGCIPSGFVDTRWVIKVALNGGATYDTINDPRPDHFDLFQLYDENGVQMSEGYLGIADLQTDYDNVFDLCLSDFFAIEDLAYVRMSCDENHPSGSTILVPPKGVFGCEPNQLPVDKKRLEPSYISKCKCDGENRFDAYCDPRGLLTGEQVNYCIISPNVECEDRQYSIWMGGDISYLACNFGESQSDLTEICPENYQVDTLQWYWYPADQEWYNCGETEIWCNEHESAWTNCGEDQEWFLESTECCVASSDNVNPTLAAMASIQLRERTWIINGFAFVGLCTLLRLVWLKARSQKYTEIIADPEAEL